jgi:hypothetical protein
MELTADILWKFLSERHRGRAHAITQGMIATVFDCDDRLICRLTMELLERGQLIASSCRPPMGVYVVETREEKLDYVRQLDNRLRETYRRRRMFDGTPIEELVRQGIFGFGAEK